MKVYDIVSLREDELPRASMSDLRSMQFVADKQILPDGKVRVLLPDGQILDFADEAELERETRRAKSRLATKIRGIPSLTKLASSAARVNWWIQISEAIYSAYTEFSTNGIDGNYEAVKMELLEVGVAAGLRVVIGTVRTLAKGAGALKWIKRLTTAKRSAQMATAALGAAGFATGGITWVGALITGAGWIATEVALYLATDYIADMIMDEFFNPEEVEKELAEQLQDELSLILGLTRSARHVDADGDGEPDNINPETGNVVDPETGQDYKYDLGDLTPDDIERLRNATPGQINQLADDPRFSDVLSDYRNRMDSIGGPNSRRRSITDFERESVREESDEGKVAGTEELQGFVNFLKDKGYDRDLRTKVVKVAQHTMRQSD